MLIAIKFDQRRHRLATTSRPKHSLLSHNNPVGSSLTVGTKFKLLEDVGESQRPAPWSSNGAVWGNPTRRLHISNTPYLGSLM
jgi:hypothetical protein